MPSADGIKAKLMRLGFRVLENVLLFAIYLCTVLLVVLDVLAKFALRYSVCFADASGGFDDAVAKYLALCSKASKREFRTTDRSRSSSMEE